MPSMLPRHISRSLCCLHWLRLLPLLALLFSAPGCVSTPPSLASVVPATPVHRLAHDAESCDLGPEAPRPVQAALDPFAIDFLNWNIQKGNDVDWSSKLARIGVSADIVTLQEAPLANEGWQTVNLATRGDAQFHAFAPGFETRRTPTGVMTVSRALPLVQCNLSSTEPFLRTPKATIVTEYALTGRSDTLLVINIHAINFTFGMAAFEQQLADASGILARHEGPVIFSGDFNTWRRARLAHVDELIAAHGLRAVEFTDDERKRVFGLPLDHVYVRGLNVLEAETYSTDTSDHNPMRVRFSI